MLEFIPALRVEFQKMRRTKTLWLTIFGFILASVIGGLFMYILKDPERARQLGLIGAKAQVFGGSADWPSFFNFMLLLVSVGGLIIFGFIFVWIFGREYSDKTYYDMLSLPTSRVTIVTAKIFTAAYWCMALVLMVFVLILGIGAALQSVDGYTVVNASPFVGLLGTVWGVMITFVGMADQTKANVVADEFRRRGIAPVTVTGFGAASPVASNETEEGRQKNRRVEVWLRTM